MAERIIRKKRGYVVNSFPFVLDEKYSKSLSKEESVNVKKKFEFVPDKKIILIVGGGDGIPKGEKILNELLKSKLNTQIAIVCGKNEVLLKGAERLKSFFKADNLKIYGYVDFIYDLINISDVVITKCGASTIMEILNLKRVPIVNDYIWEQEQGNVDYLIEKKLGIYEPRIKNLPTAVRKLLEDQQLFSSYSENISNEKIGNGVAAASKYIIDKTNL